MPIPIRSGGNAGEEGATALLRPPLKPVEKIHHNQRQPLDALSHFCLVIVIWLNLDFFFFFFGSLLKCELMEVGGAWAMPIGSEPPAAIQVFTFHVSRKKEKRWDIIVNTERLDEIHKQLLNIVIRQ